MVYTTPVDYCQQMVYTTPVD